MFRWHFLLTLTCLFPCTIQPAVAEDLATMMTYVSKDANALMIVNLKSLLDTPVAQRENWRAKLSQGTLLGSLPLPDLADTVVVSSKLLPGSLQNRWELVLISTSKPYSLHDIAEAEKQPLQKIDNLQVCYTSRNSIIVSLSPTLMAVYSPAQRQDVARWLRGRDNREGKPDYSAILGEAVAAIRDGAKLAVSFDVDESLDSNRVRQFLKAQPVLKDTKFDIDQLALAFSRMTGMHFRVNAALDVQGVFRVQFAKPIAEYASVLPDLLFAALDGVGVNMEDYRKGKAQVVGNSVTVETTLSADGLRSTVAMMQPNTVAPPVVKKPATAAPKADPVALQVERQFRQVVGIANEAHTSAGNSVNLYRAALIYDNAATRIDKLPLAVADPAVQEFGTDLAKGLRDISTAVRTAATDISVLENQIVTNVNVAPTHPSMYLPNPWGFNIWNPGIVIPQYNIQTNQPQIVARQQQVLENARKQLEEKWSQLQQRTNAMRKTLTDKYGIKFTP